MSNLLVEYRQSICLVTINRPDKLNALNKETIAELANLFLDLDKNQAIRAIVLTGAGSKAFVAGADISEFASFGVEMGTDLARSGQEQLFNRIENLSKPVIAAINGFALGGGLELAMSCHFRYASDNAKMGLPEVTLGLIPGYGGTQRLPMLIGKGLAIELITTARMLTADEALGYGLVNRICSAAELVDQCVKTAESIAKNSPLAIAQAIKAVNKGMLNRAEGYEEEIRNFGKCFGTNDFTEGTQAFLNKRKPNF